MIMLRDGDGSLDEFVRGYCDQRNIECDGGVFAIAFSDCTRDSWTIDEASRLIEDFATMFNLRRDVQPCDKSVRKC